MEVARIAAVVVLSFAPGIVPAQTETGQVRIDVFHVAGVRISGARVDVDPSPGKAAAFKITDEGGEALLNLPIGLHTLSVSKLCFRTWTGQVNVPRSNQSASTGSPITVTLSVIPKCIVDGVFPRPGNPVETEGVNLERFIDQRQLQTLPDLPFVTPRRRRRFL